MSLHTCTAEGCTRTFIDRALLQEHADAVHTFDDIRQIVSEELREAFGVADTRPGGDSCVYVWIEDLAEDWVVYTQETSNSGALMKVSYVLSPDNDVTFGTPFEVVRKTVYEPAPEED